MKFTSKLPLDAPARMAERYKAGLTLAEVGQEFGITGGSVRYYLCRLGVPLRKAAKRPSRPPNVASKLSHGNPDPQEG